VTTDLSSGGNFKFQLPPEIRSEFSSEKNVKVGPTFAEVIVKV